MTTSGQVLVINCGSSSVKFAIIVADSGAIVAEGVAERLFSDHSELRTAISEHSGQASALGDNAGHSEAMTAIVGFIQQAGLDQDIIAVGHRVVHGGEAFAESVIIDGDVRAAITAHQHLAPLHNPANLKGIEAAEAAFSNLPHVAVFDTAFHQTMPERAYLYALPHHLYTDYGVRRYGFHGSSHRYVSGEAANILQQPVAQTNVISAHLGNGCSICAVRGGKSVDTSMGLTPLEGLVMGTRSGDVDPSVPLFLEQQLGYNAEQVNDLYNKESGLLGLSGLSNDCRTLEEAALAGNTRAQLALDIFSYRLAKYVASYMVATAPLHALILTGGIGENSSYIREALLRLLEPLGYQLDHGANNHCRFGIAGQISAKDSPTVLVIPTNEEWVIAADAARLVATKN
ncbi:MAG: acetate kinase [Halioglobus sp.]